MLGRGAPHAMVQIALDPSLEGARHVASMGIFNPMGAYPALCARRARAVCALCEKLAVLHHREFGKFRRLKGRH